MGKDPRIKGPPQDWEENFEESPDEKKEDEEDEDEWDLNQKDEEW